MMLRLRNISHIVQTEGEQKIPRVFYQVKKIIIIDHGTKNKSGNKLEKKKKQKGQSNIFKKQNLSAQIKFGLVLLLLHFLRCPFQNGNYGLQQIASTYQILPSTLGGNIPFFPIFIDKKHITKSICIQIQTFKVVTSKPEDQQLDTEALKIKDRRLHKL